MTVFICHASRDDAQVAALVRHLQAAHETVWLDQSLLGGEAWWSKILHQIRSCTVFLVAMSNHSLQSKPCRAELNYAKALGLPILPVLIGEVDSYRIDPIFTVQSVDYRNPDVTSGATLIAAVRERTAERKELPDPLPEPPALPYEYLQRLGVAIDSPDELSPTEQTTTLLELRRALRDEDDETVRADITRLLRSLRRRSEATHTTVADIDELLSKEPTASAQTAYSGQPQREEFRPVAATDSVATGGGTAPSTPRWREPKTIAIAAAALLVVAIVAIVGYLSAPSKPDAAPAPPSSSPAAPASAAAANQMSGHYVKTSTTTTGLSNTYDWYFTPCGDGCAFVASTPAGQSFGQARVVNGEWTMDITENAACSPTSNVANAESSHYVWEPNTLAGTVQVTDKWAICGEAAPTSFTNNIQLKLVGQTSPGSAASNAAAPAIATAANQMSGHYILTSTDPASGQSTTEDLFFTPCGDGCASVIVGGPTPGPLGQARLVNGQWTMDTTDNANCADGSQVPIALSSHYAWDLNTLAGTVQLTTKAPACGDPAGFQTIHSVQLKQAP